MVRRLGLGKNNHLSYASLALNPRRKVYQVYTNNDPRMTFDLITARPNFCPSWGGNIGSMLHGVCRYALVVLLRWANRGPLASCVSNNFFDGSPYAVCYFWFRVYFHRKEIYCGLFWLTTSHEPYTFGQLNCPATWKKVHFTLGAESKNYWIQQGRNRVYPKKTSLIWNYTLYLSLSVLCTLIYVKIPMECQNHKAQPSSGNKRGRNSELQQRSHLRTVSRKTTRGKTHFTGTTALTLQGIKPILLVLDLSGFKYYIKHKMAVRVANSVRETSHKNIKIKLTHFSLASHTRDNCKQCRPILDATESGVWSGPTLFALNIGMSANYGLIKN